MIQRLEKMRKNAFGSSILFGENNNSTISGIWVWRGHELAFTVGLVDNHEITAKLPNSLHLSCT